MVYTPHEHIRMRNEDGEIIGCFDLEDCKRRSKEAYEHDGEDSEGCDQCGGPYLSVDTNHIIAVLNKGLNPNVFNHHGNEADAKLIADAPLLLEEVKRMTRVLNMCKTTFDVLRETEFGRGLNWDTNEIFYQTAAHLNDWVSPEDNPDGWVGDLPPETVDELFTNAKEMVE